MTEDLLHTVRGDGVAIVTLNRPKSRNALSRKLLFGLYETMSNLNEDPAVRAIVLTGTDPAFCGGVDLKELMHIPGAGREVGPRSGPMFNFATPVIGAINGPAFTGGFELALNCHWLIVSERAVFADTHIKFGLTPGWGLSLLLADAVGKRRARQIALTGQPVTAEEALEWGLVNEVHPHEQFLDRAIEVAAQVAGQDARAVQTISQIFNEQDAVTHTPLWQIESSRWIDPDVTK